MDILKIAAIGLITAFSAVTLKDAKSNLFIVIILAGSCIILLMLLDYFAEIFQAISAMTQKIGLSNDIIRCVLKIVGTGYITEFAAGIIEETASKALAEKIILGGRLLILVLALPIFSAFLTLITELVQ